MYLLAIVNTSTVTNVNTLNAPIVNTSTVTNVNTLNVPIVNTSTVTNVNTRDYARTKAPNYLLLPCVVKPRFIWRFSGHWAVKGQPGRVVLSVPLQRCWSNNLEFSLGTIS